MKTKYLLIIAIISSIIFPQSFTLLSWNIQNLGNSKNKQEISIIVDIIKDYDIVLIQEVNAKDLTAESDQTIAQIVEELKRLGDKWKYSISNPTYSRNTYWMEKYAILWNTSKIMSVDIPYLDSESQNIIYKEPFIAEFQLNDRKDSFYVINVHSVTPRIRLITTKSINSVGQATTVGSQVEIRPEDEIKHFINYPERLKSDNIIIAGDFNLSEEHIVWNPLKNKGFKPALINKPTFLKKECIKNGEYLIKNIDNIFYNSNVFENINSGSIDFVGNCSNLVAARKVSDHLPVFIELNILNHKYHQ